MSEITWRVRRHRRTRPREHITNIRRGYKRNLGNEAYSIVHPGVFLTKGQAQKYARTARYRGVKARVVTVVMAGRNVGFAVFERGASRRMMGRLSSRRKRVSSKR